jgi:DNA polymerase III delta prime subunit
MTFEERHRPKAVQDLVFADPTVAATITRYATVRPSKPLLLYGEPGTGKSEALRLIVEAQFAQAGIASDDFTVNGADAGKGLFDKILNMAQMQMWAPGMPALIIIDEIDEVEDALPGKTRTFIEQHKSVQLLASTNYVKKLKPALQSRMRCVEVKKPLNTDWVTRAQAILAAEGARVTQSGVAQLLQNFSGDARDFIDYMEEQVDAAKQFAPAASAQPRTVASVLNQASGSTP